jgi:prolyl-tRNA synthetase
LGIPVQLVLGEKSVAQGEVELKDRRSGEVRKVKIDEAAGLIAASVTAGR